MSQHPPERITPLPWKTARVPTNVDMEIEVTIDVQGDNGSAHVADCGSAKNETAKANAAYIVHCANNYTKLEALNAELVEALEEYEQELIVLCKVGTLGKVRALIQKAKGGGNVK